MAKPPGKSEGLMVCRQRNGEGAVSTGCCNGQAARSSLSLTAGVCQARAWRGRVLSSRCARCPGCRSTRPPSGSTSTRTAPSSACPERSSEHGGRDRALAWPGHGDNSLTESGWSVVVKGPAQLVYERVDTNRHDQLGLRSWADIKARAQRSASSTSMTRSAWVAGLTKARRSTGFWYQVVGRQRMRPSRAMRCDHAR